MDGHIVRIGCTHTHTHARTHARTHAHTHTHTHTHTVAVDYFIIPQNQSQLLSQLKATPEECVHVYTREHKRGGKDRNRE